MNINLSQIATDTSLNPHDYFNAVKDCRQYITDDDLDRYYENCLILLAKMQKTGQKSAMRRLIFNIDCVTKERELVKAGINSFVYESDITNYIENVASKVVKIVELENFNREVPDEIVDVIDRVGHLFDQMYVVFTDYTGEEERKVTAARREKDPILFGSFQNKRGSLRAERFYYLGDWVDEYCDLTLDKMVSEMKQSQNIRIVHDVMTPKDLDDIRAMLNATEEDNGIFRVNEAKRTPSFFDKVRSFLKR